MVLTQSSVSIQCLAGSEERGERVLLKCGGQLTDNQTSRLAQITPGLIKYRTGAVDPSEALS